MPKAPDAFRTISEVADWLEVQTHVLRFWETKFPQVKPLKRAGGRRYYRPADMLLLGGIKRLLHDDGMTIKGVQKMLRERGVREVADLSRPLRTDEEGYLTVAPAANAPRAPRPRTVPPLAMPDAMPDAVSEAGQPTALPHVAQAAASQPAASQPATHAQAAQTPAAQTTVPQDYGQSGAAEADLVSPVMAQADTAPADAPAQTDTPSPNDPAADPAPEAPFIDLAAPYADTRLAETPAPNPEVRAMDDPERDPPADSPSIADSPSTAPAPDTGDTDDTPAQPPVGVATEGLAEPRHNPLRDPAEPGSEIRAPRPFRPGGYGIADGAIQAPPTAQQGSGAEASASSDTGPVISRQLAHSLPGDATRARLRPIHDALVALRERMTKNP